MNAARSIVLFLLAVSLVDSPIVAAAKDALAPGDAYPEVIRQVPPEYPSEFAKKRIGGEAVIEFIVERDGTVQIAKIVKETHAGLGQAALACVKKWMFKPGTKAGVPVRCLMQVPIVFGK